MYLWLLMFLRNVWGVLNQPYTTMRRLSENGRLIDTLGIFISIGFFFFAVSPLRADSFHPFLFTFNFGLLTSGAAFTFLLIVLSLYSVGKLLKGIGSVRSMGILWAYSLIPTLIWFGITSVLFVFLPPPRTLSIAGKLFSIVFVALSLGLFFWKGILYYLTLRFGMKLDLPRILFASLILFPLGILYAVVMYKLGIFRIPFI